MWDEGNMLREKISRASNIQLRGLKRGGGGVGEGGIAHHHYKKFNCCWISTACHKKILCRRVEHSGIHKCATGAAGCCVLFQDRSLLLYKLTCCGTSASRAKKSKLPYLTQDCQRIMRISRKGVLRTEPTGQQRRHSMMVSCFTMSLPPEN